jgi:hypothetical protein
MAAHHHMCGTRGAAALPHAARFGARTRTLQRAVNASDTFGSPRCIPGAMQAWAAGAPRYQRRTQGSVPSQSPLRQRRIGRTVAQPPAGAQVGQTPSAKRHGVTKVGTQHEPSPSTGACCRFKIHASKGGVIAARTSVHRVSGSRNSKAMVDSVPGPPVPAACGVDGSARCSLATCSRVPAALEMGGSRYHTIAVPASMQPPAMVQQTTRWPPEAHTMTPPPTPARFQHRLKRFRRAGRCMAGSDARIGSSVAQ